jgi:hypothetical protein
MKVCKGGKRQQRMQKRIEKYWKKYRGAQEFDALPFDIKVVLKSTFFAGAAASLEIMSNQIGGKVEATEENTRVFEELIAEIELYASIIGMPQA